ncbi:phosphatase regulator [Pichia kluyveri]|uniref:mRNA stability protein n=1 Tax=Pichia kluyveri TaxID=36015 RepID=A0AAV5QZ55_PICKL|nr:phosphatase regulator [Pichia kluyveri]
MSNLSPNDPLYTPPTNNVDLSSLSPQELKLYKLYGKLPKTNDILRGKLKDRKFFDSGDYAMSKAHGKVDEPEQVGILNPLHNPEIENVARINRNSVAAGSVSSPVTHKSKLEEDVSDVSN